MVEQGGCALFWIKEREAEVKREMDSDQVLGLKCLKCVRFSLGGREIEGGGSSGHGGLAASTQMKGKI